MNLPSNTDSSLASISNNGVLLAVKAKPGTSRARPPRIVPLADGKYAVELTVSAAPEDGKANKAILSFLAKELGLPKRAFAIKIGATHRQKVIEIHGDSAALYAQIVTWLNSLET